MVSVSQQETIPLTEEDWTIEPQRSLFDLRQGELWRYRDLVILFVRRDYFPGY
jgi:lipopolysaccharide transport system permease protein